MVELSKAKSWMAKLHYYTIPLFEDQLYSDISWLGSVREVENSLKNIKLNYK